VLDYNQTIFEALALISQFIPDVFQPAVEEMALLTLPYLGEYAEEIRAGATAAGIPLGKATLLNIIYEVEAGCTSIVAQDSKGNIVHGRNLDFNLAAVLRNLTIQVEFQKGGKTLYWGTTYAGYYGLLTGMRPGGFAVSLDQRDSGYLIENLLEAFFIHGASAACFLIRDTLQQETAFDAAVTRLANTPLVAPSYIIVSGTQPGEGTVITRDRNDADLWQIDASTGKWFEVETNYDHWDSPDTRRKVAEQAMTKIGQDNINLQQTFNVLSIHPVENSGTTYTTLMSAATGDFSTTIRDD
jgi:N-acylethanolamine-hydrolysing acid amidase